MPETSPPNGDELGPTEFPVPRKSWNGKPIHDEKFFLGGEQHLCSDDVLPEIDTVSKAPNPMLAAARVEIWRVTRSFSGRRTCNATRHLQV